MPTGIGNEWDPGDPPEIHNEPSIHRGPSNSVTQPNERSSRKRVPDDREPVPVKDGYSPGQINDLAQRVQEFRQAQCEGGPMSDKDVVELVRAELEAVKQQLEEFRFHLSQTIFNLRGANENNNWNRENNEVREAIAFLRKYEEAKFADADEIRERQR